MRRETLVAWAIIVLVLAAMPAKSFLVSVPAVRAHNGPAQFDAVRATERLGRILGDQRAHPADSDADDAVRARLTGELQAMGLRPVVRDQFACNDFQKARLVACARVHNVVAMLGPAKGKALLLNAHYDSVPVGPGAADDGIGVATLLEIGSILKNRPLRRPLILLFNEGEELGLVGARAFLADPLSRNVDSLLNFEARGVTGPVTMFETSEPNASAVAAFAGAVDRPYASSLSTDVARLIPNDTDVTTFKERGWLALNFAITGNETRYHSPGDDLAALDMKSVQEMGDQALATASQLSAGAPQIHGQRIFFDLLGRAFVQMPLPFGAGGLLLLLALFAAIGWRRRVLARGAAVVFSAMLVAGALSWLATAVMGALVAGTYWRAHPQIAFLAIDATALFGALAVLRTFGANLETRQLRTAYWFVFLVLGALLAIAAPGAIIYFLIPPAVALLGVGIARWSRPAETLGGLAALLLLYLTWGELLAALEELFTPGPLWVVAPVVAIMITLPAVEANHLFSRIDRRALLPASASIALLAWIIAGTSPAYSADHQQRFTIEHVTEFPSRQSQWSVLNDGAPLPKAYRGAEAWHQGKLPFFERVRWFAKAPFAPGVQAPSIQLLETVRNGAEHRSRIRLRANGSERILLIAPADSRVSAAGAAGFVRPIGSADTSGKFIVSCTGRGCDGVELTIVQGKAAPSVFTLVGARNGLPASAASLLFARPRFARPQYTPDETIAVTRIGL
jgi:hypothetical protein